MLGSLFEQASFLFRNIEYHLLANHLFENIKALIFAGMFFECSSSKRWYKRACRLLDRQIKEQILDDGGHFERSPMYHNIVMGGLIESVQLFRLNGRQYPQEIDRRLSKAVNFSLNMLHPDREIPLFNDSALSKELLSIELIQAGSALYCDGDTKDISGVYSTFVFLIFGDRGKEICNSIYIPAYDDSIKHFKQSGFYIINQRDLNAKLFIDCGSTCPEYNPGHTHCGGLSYELSVFGKRWIIDPGVYQYSGRWRNYFRGTGAHNTIQIDGMEQIEIWDSFRVASRLNAESILFKKLDQGTLFIGSHDGYYRLGSELMHYRILYAHQEGWRIQDIVGGNGAHSWMSSIHLHPSISVKQSDECSIVTTDGCGNYVVIIPDGDGEMVIEKGYYSERFGEKQECNVIRVKGKGDCPLKSGYHICPITT